MNYLYFDIETVGLGQWVEDAVASIEAPQNYVKEEAKRAYKERQAEKIAERLAFDPTYAQIVTIGFALNESPIHSVTQVGDQNEEWLLRQFWRMFDDLLEHHGAPTHGSVTWVGHNIRRFDLPFLVARHLLHGVRPHQVIPVGHSRKINDTLEIYQGSGKASASLDALAKVMGLPTLYGSGADVAKWWEEGDWKEIDQHCRADVAAMRGLHTRLLSIAEVR